MRYDCTEDVKKHKANVEYWMHDFATQIKDRAKIHDDSKLKNPTEKAMFDLWTPELKEREFGSEAYKIALDGMGKGIELHYKANRHHPEHYANGVNDMTIIDVIEMLSDWMAAAQAKYTHVDLAHASERFGLSEQLVRILANTLREEDFWCTVNGVPVVDLCPPEHREGHIEGVTGK